MFLVASLISVSSFAKAPPCVQWYGTCVKSKIRDVYSYDGADGHISQTQAAVKYEYREQDGSVSQKTLAARIDTYFGIPGIFAPFKERSSLRGACKQILAELEASRCE